MTDEERELRSALSARAAAVPVGRADEPGLGHRLAVVRRRRLQARLAGTAMALVAVLGAVSLVAADGDTGDNVVAGPDGSVAETSTSSVDTTAVDTTVAVAPAPTSTAPPSPGTTTSTAPTTVPRTTTTSAPLPPVPDDALWPPPGSATSFPTPDRAALDFARRFLAMATPQPTPGRVSASGYEATVDIRPVPTGGPVTTVLLRRVEGRGWVVVGCSAENILVEQPAPGAAVTSPLTVRGRTQAFEGHVDVEVRRDGAMTPIGQAFGTGASDTMAPYEATVTFTRPSAPRGSVVVSEPRMDDGTQGPLSATVVRIAF